LGFSGPLLVPKQGGCLPLRRNVILTSYRWDYNGKLTNMLIKYMELAWVARAIARLDEKNQMLQMKILTKFII
jgi:hypothetical protein